MENYSVIDIGGTSSSSLEFSPCSDCLFAARNGVCPAACFYLRD